MSDGLRAKYGWSLSDVNIIGSAGLAALYVTYMIIGPLFDKYGVTITMYTAIFTGTASYLFICLSYLGFFNTGVTGMSILFFVVGYASSASFLATIGTNTSNYPERYIGMVTGTLLLFYGLAGMIFSQIYNIAFSFTDGLGKFFVLLTILNFVVYSIGALFIKRYPFRKDVVPLIAEDIPLTAVADKPIRPNENTQLLNSEEILMTPLQILASPKFWIYETLMVLTQGLTFMQNVNIIIRSSASQNANPNDLITGTTIQLTIVSIFQSIGRVGAGTISDIVLAKGIDRSILLIFAQGIIFVGHLLLGVADTSLLSLDIYLALCSALIGLGFGGNGALFPLLTRGMFGSKYYGTASSYVMIGVPVGFITSNLIFGLVYDNQLSYQRSAGGPSDYCYGKQCLQTSFIIAIVTQFISFALSILLYVMLQKRRQ